MAIPLRALIVEDSQDHAELLLRELRHGGYDPIFERVETLEAMKTALAQQTWDIVFADYTMPRFRGTDALALLKQREQDVPFIFVSGTIGEDTAVEAMKAGAHDYIKKGDLKRLIPAVERELREAVVRREQKRTESALQESEDRFRKVFEESPIGMVLVDSNFRLIRVNSAFCRMVGYAEEELTRLTFADITHPEDIENDLEQARRVFSGEIPSYQMEKRYITKNKEIIWVHLTASMIRDREGRSLYGLGIVENITERKQMEERLNYLATHDPLTNLPNRAVVFDRLSQALVRAPWNKRLIAVMFLDLDHFKRINDTLGHAIGDLLLKAVAERLATCVRGGDTVARLGGDEFTFILADVARVEDVSKVASKIFNAFSTPFWVEGHELFITPSIGISLYPNDGESPETLLKNADTAMYRVKELGRNNFQLYSAAMNARASERLKLESSLRHALERKEFLLHYQPRLDIATGQITGVEALLRWQRPDSGMVSPTEFIPLAEETGLIVPIGEWVLHTACAQNKAWQVAGLPPICVAVNLSARQFQQKNLLETVARVLEEAGLAPNHLELELTEDIIMKDMENTIETLRGLQAMGIQISVDDFGTGYSSLAYLKKLPVDAIKIDKSFVINMKGNKNDEMIVHSAINLAHNLGLKVIAEGVEDQKTRDLLAALGCDAAQGYYMARPMPAADLTRWLKESPWGLK